MVLYNSTYRVQRCYVRAFWYELDVFSDDSQIETAVSALALDIRQRLQLLLVLFHNSLSVKMAKMAFLQILTQYVKAVMLYTKQIWT